MRVISIIVIAIFLLAGCGGGGGGGISGAATSDTITNYPTHSVTGLPYSSNWKTAPSKSHVWLATFDSQESATSYQEVYEFTMMPTDVEYQYLIVNTNQEIFTFGADHVQVDMIWDENGKPVEIWDLDSVEWIQGFTLESHEGAYKW